MPSTETEASSAEAWRSAVLDAILMLGATVLFLVMFYEMYAPSRNSDVLNPLLAAAAGMVLLWPLRKQPAARALLVAGVLLLLFWVADVLSGVLLPFAGVYLLAFLLNPLVAHLQWRFNMPRWASAATVTALALGAVALFVLVIVPDFIAELQVLANRILASPEQIRDALASSSLVAQLESAGLMDAGQFADQIAATAQGQVTYLTNNLPQAVQETFASAGSLLGYLIVVCVLPAALYYTVKDYPHVARGLTRLLPTFGGRRDYLFEVSSVVGNYVRGMLILSAIAAVNVSVALLLLDVPFAILIGLIAGTMNMIPNFGALITAVVGVLIAVVFGEPWYWDALTVLLVLLGQNILEQSVLSPKILSREVGVHPMAGARP